MSNFHSDRTEDLMLPRSLAVTRFLVTIREESKCCAKESSDGKPSPIDQRIALDGNDLQH